jgi:type II secretory pathway component PulF
MESENILVQMVKLGKENGKMDKELDGFENGEIK